MYQFRGLYHIVDVFVRRFNVRTDMTSLSLLSEFDRVYDMYFPLGRPIEKIFLTQIVFISGERYEVNDPTRLM